MHADGQSCSSVLGCADSSARLCCKLGESLLVGEMQIKHWMLCYRYVCMYVFCAVRKGTMVQTQDSGKGAVMVVGQSSKLSTCRDEAGKGTEATRAAGKGEKKGEGDGISF